MADSRSNASRRDSENPDKSELDSSLSSRSPTETGSANIIFRSSELPHDSNEFVLHSPNESDTDSRPSTQDNPPFSPFAYESCSQNSSRKGRRKKAVKKSQRRSSQEAERPISTVEEPLDKKESNVNLLERISSSDSNDESPEKISQEKIPSCTEHHIRRLDKNHNNFKVTSLGVQTDWSWLRDRQKLKEEEVCQDDLTKVMEMLKHGMHGGIISPTPAIVIKESHDNVVEDRRLISTKRNSSKVYRQDTKRTGGSFSTSNNEHEPSKNSHQKLIKKPSRSLARSATKKRLNSVKSNRKIKSATSTSRKSLAHNIDEETSDAASQAKKNNLTSQPELLKFHREKTLGENLPSLEKADVSNSSDAMPSDGLFSGPCQFCGKPIMTVPPFDEFDEDDAELFCCPEYKHFIKLHLQSVKDLADDGNEEEAELIDINPHAPYGNNKQSRKAPRDRIVERMREREFERQRVATQANIFSFARQMKTIQYSLASTKCMAEGWTVNPKPPVEQSSNRDEEIFQVEVNSTLLQRSEVLHTRLYENGKRFLTIFPDGTGCCYYPNGNVAVMITSTEKEKYTYIVQSNEKYDDLEDSGLLAIFEPSGNAICYYEINQKIRLFINPHGGIELDKQGRRKKRWQWFYSKGQSQAPAFQPICIQLNKYLSLRLLNQNNMALIFSALKRSIRFNVGSNLMAHGLEGHGTFSCDSSEHYLSDKKKELSALLREIQNTLRFSKHAVVKSKLLRREFSSSESLPPITSRSTDSVYVD
ncbi:glutamate-rich protein 6-like [Clytia hemisphaerica]|uniref:FAM194 C-terminal domain-containing protein n=1 Tax=Clytia hemisphaerica TaxID=252671 RepID=A0A7M5V010_9CNID